MYLGEKIENLIERAMFNIRVNLRGTSGHLHKYDGYLKGTTRMDPTAPKHLLQSKTFWTNLLAPVFLWVASKYGLNLDPDTQGMIILLIMSLVNIGLRFTTSQPVTLNPAALHR